MTTNDDARVELCEQAPAKPESPMQLVARRDSLEEEVMYCNMDINGAAYDAGVSYADFIKVMRYLNGERCTAF